MKYNRKQRSSNPIDILKFETVETGAVFKQYDVNTSILEIALVANGEPVKMDGSFMVYVTAKPTKKQSRVPYRYLNDKSNEEEEYKILLRAERTKSRSITNIINVFLSPLTLSFSGDMIAEIILVDLENQERVTSQSFTFKIMPSLTPNQQEEIDYTVVEDLDGTYITDSKELKLLAIDGVSGFKLSFTGAEVDKILKDVEGFSYDENNQSLETLRQKDEELQEGINEAKEERKSINSKIKLLENKDTLLDVEVEKLKSYNSTNDSNIEEIKSNISELEGYNSTNDEKIQSIDSDIDKLKKYDESNTNSVEEIKEDIVNLKSYNSSNDESIRNINSDIESFKQYNSNNTEVVNGIKSDLQNYKSSNNQTVSDVRENLESYKTSNNQSVNSINENLENFKNTTNQTVNDINVDISSLKDYNTTNDSKIEEINGSIERNINSISENLQKINSNTSLIEVNKEAISSINLKNEEIERDLTSSKENIENNKNDILNLNKKVNKNTEDIKLLKEGSIGGSNSNKEVIDARTATTGEKFDTLDERIDHEVDRLNKKIDVTMLQQEDKESHVVENTVEGMTTDMIIKGRTLQNLIKNESYDLKSFPITLENNYFTFTTDGNFQFRNIISNEKNLVPSTEYTIIYEVKENTLSEGNYVEACNTTNFNSSVVIDSVTKPGIYSKRVLTKSQLDEAGHALYFNASMNNALGQILKLRVMLLKGNLTDIPNYFEGIKSFGEAEGNKISILSSGANLINPSKCVDGFIYQSDIDKNKKTSPCFELNLVKGTTYFFTEEVYGCYLDNSRKFIENVGFVGNKLVSKYTGIAVFRPHMAYSQENSNYKNLQEFINKFMVNEGQNLLPYEPYKEDKKDILLQDLGFDEGLRGLGNAQDEINSIKDMAIKKIEKYNFIGNEHIVVHNMRDNTIPFTLYFNSGFLRGKNNNANFLCNSIITTTLCYSKDVEGVFGTSDGIYGAISKTKLESNDSEGVKKYLRNILKECYYELAEPVETPLSENINLKTFGERTYVSFENTISGTSSFKAPVDTTATISRLNRENRALEEENKTLRQDFESTTLSLTDSDLELVKQNVDIDFRLMEVEFALDIPQSTLSSNINFKNKKGEVKSMARTPYEMMKIVILSGDYDREDYIHKVGKYYERGRMTKEEYDELMSLMTADEVISKKI